MDKVITLDFETAAIQKRPNYPPRPVGVSIQWPHERKPKYWAWGHPTTNNCDAETGFSEVARAWSSGIPILFHNAKFDMDVAETHIGVRELPWHLMHDTQFLLFLLYPHDSVHSLKPVAAKYLNMPPEERDAVFDWLKDHAAELISQGLLPAGTKVTEKSAGAHISLAPGKLVGAYANGDVERTLKLYKFLWPRMTGAGMREAYDRERRLLRPLLLNERAGVRTDQAALDADLPVFEKQYLLAEQKLRKLLKSPELDFNKDEKVGAALESIGAVREWTTTRTGKLSVSAKNLTLYTWNKPEIFHLLGYRNKLEVCLVNYMRPWAAAGGIVHPGWNQTRGAAGGTRTGRLSGSPNFMAVAKSFEDKGDGWVCPTGLEPLPHVRQYLLPDKYGRAEGVWGRRDYNQQELRIVGHFEGGSLKEAYLNNPRLDVHEFVRKFCAEQLNRDVPRTPIKTLNFGYIYGQGVASMAAKLGVSKEEIKQLRALQLQALSGLPDLSAAIKQLANAGDPITTWGGRTYYKEPNKVIGGRSVDFGYKLINYLVQGSAADCTKESICRYHEEGYGDARFLLTVHDENNISAPKGAIKHEMSRLRKIMQSVEFDVPMLSDGEIGPNWADVVKFKEVAA